MTLSYKGLPEGSFAMPGPLRERLNGLVIAGAKYGTFSLDVLDQIDNEVPPTTGARSIMYDSTGEPVAVTERLSRVVLPLGAVSWEQVQTEGESFTSVADWRIGHEEFWSQFLDEIRTHTNDPHWMMSDDTLAVYETFRLTDTLPRAHAGRYPVVELIIAADDIEEVSTLLFDLDTVGIEELTVDLLTTPSRRNQSVLDSPIALRSGFASFAAAVAAEAELPKKWNPRFEVIVGDDWLDTWREHFDPIRAGRLIIAPAWRATEDEVLNHPEMLSRVAGDMVVWLDPGRAWGTGAHQSTRLALLALQKRSVQEASVLDVGCGSGILAVSALMLGASSALCTDVESTAATVTMENAERNSVGDSCRATSTPVQDLRGTFDLVLANILAPVLIELAPHLRARLARNGYIILSGLIEEQEARVLAAFGDMKLVDRNTEGSWVCLTLHQ